MKKILLISSFLLISFSINPLSVAAFSLNPFKWFVKPARESTTTVATTSSAQTSAESLSTGKSSSNLQAKIDALTAQVSALKSQLISCQNSTQDKNTNASPLFQQNSSASSASSPKTPIFMHYDSYRQVNIADFVNQPRRFLGVGIEILVGKIVNFLPAGGGGGDSNYIEIEDATANSSSERMMVLVENDDDYRYLLSQLKKGDIIDVWGMGQQSQMFHTAGSSADTSAPEAVISAQRVDRCNTSGYCGGDTINILYKNK